MAAGAPLVDEFVDDIWYDEPPPDAHEQPDDSSDGGPATAESVTAELAGDPEAP